MVYGAAYDLRRTRVMLLCGSDLLESFGVAGLWSDEDVSAAAKAISLKIVVPLVIEFYAADELYAYH